MMQDVADRLAILDLLARYTRGVDRCDLVVLSAVWAPDAVVDYGAGATDAAAWAEGLVAALQTHFLRTQHMLGQSIIDLDGDTARAETYCRAYHEQDGDQGPTEMIVGGRYLDEFGASEADAVRRLWHAWNGAGDIVGAWQSFAANRQSIGRHGKVWASQLDRLGDLANNLVRFVHEN